jgi:pantetheine-phosphate adenylyltransferase
MHSVGNLSFKSKFFIQILNETFVGESYKYASIAVGGTFDHIHVGHRALLKRAFDTGELVYIGLTSDRFASSEGKRIQHEFASRRDQLARYINETYPGRRYVITVLESRFGQGIFTSGIEAIAVSEETLAGVSSANKERVRIGLPELKIEVVPMVLANDGKRVSSTRIRGGEIDAEGKSK